MNDGNAKLHRSNYEKYLRCEVDRMTSEENAGHFVSDQNRRSRDFVTTDESEKDDMTKRCVSVVSSTGSTETSPCVAEQLSDTIPQIKIKPFSADVSHSPVWRDCRTTMTGC